MCRRAILLVALWALAGCGETARGVPFDVASYEAQSPNDRLAYPPTTVCLHNLQRVMDAQLPPEQRKASLELVVRLGGDDPEVRQQLAELMASDGASPLRDSVLEFLVSRDSPDVAGLIVQALPSLRTQSTLRDVVLDWLSRHSTPQVLAEVVKIWSAEPPEGPNESQFRSIVQQNTGMAWDRALVESINRSGFPAGGSALEVLVRRLDGSSLRAKLLAVAPQTEAMRTLRTLIAELDYLPTGREDLRLAARLLGAHSQAVPGAARLARQWRDQTAYSFELRDMHLLARLSADALRDTELTREQLLADLERSISTRPAAPAPPKGAAPPPLSAQADQLSMADLWRLRLLDEMLTRPHVQMAIAVMADRDRADAARAWGGVIFYESGRATARIYPPPDAGGDDKTYAPSEQAASDLRDSLCRFHAHFERANNAERSLPSQTELLEAATGGFCGLLLTTLGDDTFCATYYTPRGVVVSLGAAPLRR